MHNPKFEELQFSVIPLCSLQLQHVVHWGSRPVSTLDHYLHHILFTNSFNIIPSFFTRSLTVPYGRERVETYRLLLASTNLDYKDTTKRRQYRSSQSCIYTHTHTRSRAHTLNSRKHTHTCIHVRTRSKTQSPKPNRWMSLIRALV